MSHAADPDALEGFGKTMKDQIAVIEKIIKDVDTPLGTIVWTGPGRDQFQEAWDMNFKGALGKLNTALENAGTDCQNRAQGVREVLGRSGG